MPKNTEVISISIPKELMAEIEKEMKYELEKVIKSKKANMKEVYKNMNKSQFIVRLIKLGLRAKREGYLLFD